jgi:hypothetical protein
MFFGQLGNRWCHIGRRLEHVFDGETFASALEGISTYGDDDAVI